MQKTVLPPSDYVIEGTMGAGEIIEKIKDIITTMNKWNDMNRKLSKKIF